VAETRYYRIEFDPNPGDPWHIPVKDVPVSAVFGLSLISSGVLQHKDGISLAYKGATFSLDINNGHFDPVDQKLIHSDNGSPLMRMTEQEAIQYLRSIGLNAEIEYKPDYSFARGEVVAVTLPPNCTMQIDGKRYIDKGTAIKLWIGS
jgi:hypothetical protein